MPPCASSDRERELRCLRTLGRFMGAQPPVHRCGGKILKLLRSIVHTFSHLLCSILLALFQCCAVSHENKHKPRIPYPLSQVESQVATSKLQPHSPITAASCTRLSLAPLPHTPGLPSSSSSSSPSPSPSQFHPRPRPQHLLKCINSRTLHPSQPRTISTTNHQTHHPPSLMANTRTRAPLTLPPLSPPSAPTRTTSVRRNLFHTQLSRRPPSARTGDPVRSRTVSTATSSASTLVLGGGEWGFGGGDIVVRACIGSR